ncbi:MAG: Stp1/IreP family PP2C-type Ser/Thr phosphatase [Eubacterium sp.]|nr:Stp1/IreP family PP2C-type Ser/Thr phosphatase [Eubacterium sp.]
MKISSLTDIGVQREMNQDYFYTSEEAVGPLPNLFMVADGMGGHKAGEFASRSAVEWIVRSVQSAIGNDPEKILDDAINDASTRILKHARSHSEMKGMGTTVVAATLLDHELLVANVGDSRLYVLDQTLRQISQDHSLVQEMVRLGEMDPETAKHHPDKNIITRAVGVTETVNVDFFRVDLRSVKFVLLCSDGLTNMVEDPEVEQILKDESLSVSRKVKQLVSQANAAGGRDNITVVLIENDSHSEVSESC